MVQWVYERASDDQCSVSLSMLPWSQLCMWHGIFSGDDSFNVSMWLAGGNVDVIFKLQDKHTYSGAVSHGTPATSL